MDPMRFPAFLLKLDDGADVVLRYRCFGGVKVNKASFWLAIIGVIYNLICLYFAFMDPWHFEYASFWDILLWDGVDILDIILLLLVIVALYKRKPGLFLPYLILTPIDLMIDLVAVIIPAFIREFFYARDTEHKLILLIPTTLIILFYAISIAGEHVFFKAYLRMKSPSRAMSVSTTALYSNANASVVDESEA